jgi:hypothetical protein
MGAAISNDRTGAAAKRLCNALERQDLPVLDVSRMATTQRCGGEDGRTLLARSMDGDWVYNIGKLTAKQGLPDQYSHIVYVHEASLGVGSGPAFCIRGSVVMNNYIGTGLWEGSATEGGLLYRMIGG